VYEETGEGTTPSTPNASGLISYSWGFDSIQTLNRQVKPGLKLLSVSASGGGSFDARRAQVKTADGSFGRSDYYLSGGKRQRIGMDYAVLARGAAFRREQNGDQQLLLRVRIRHSDYSACRVGVLMTLQLFDRRRGDYVLLTGAGVPACTWSLDRRVKVIITKFS
jgi:hypothetical protein